MDLVNAIAKVRFSSARPQRVILHKGQSLVVEMLCLESGQEVHIHSGEWAYYVVTGTASLVVGGRNAALPAGQLATTAPDEPHLLTNPSEQRLVCLAFGREAPKNEKT